MIPMTMMVQGLVNGPVAEPSEHLFLRTIARALEASSLTNNAAFQRRDQSVQKVSIAA